MLIVLRPKWWWASWMEPLCVFQSCKLAVPQEGPPVLQPTNIVYHSKDYNNEGLRKFKIDHRSIDGSYTCTSSMRIWYLITATCQQHTHTCLIIAIIIFMHTYPPSIDIRHTHTHTHTYTHVWHCTCYPAPICVISASSHLYKQQEKPLITPVHIQLHV